MFITFEGIDGSGKTTQLNLLADYLISKNLKVLKLREPGSTPISEKIREILLDKSLPISPVTELLLFNSARSYLVEHTIKPALKEDIIVLCDRYYDSTTAYQSYGRGLEINDVIKVNSLASNGLIPDLTFYIDIDLDTHHQRTLGKDFDRMEISGDEFFQSVINGYRELCKIYPERMIMIKSQENIEDTFELIIIEIKNKYNL